MFNTWDNIFNELTRDDTCFIHRCWKKNDKGYDVIVSHAGIDEVEVLVDDARSIRIFGEQETFGEKFCIDVNYVLPCKQSEIEQIAYQTINGVTMIRIFTQQPKERKIPINKI